MIHGGLTSSRHLAHGDRLRVRVGGVQDVAVELARREEDHLDGDLIARDEVTVGVLLEAGLRVSVGEVQADEAPRLVLGHVAEAGQDHAVRDGRVHGRQGVGVAGPLRVAHVHDLLEGRREARDLAAAGQERQLAQRGHREPLLDLADGIPDRRRAEPDAVPEEGGVPAVEGVVDVAVVVLVGREVPVASVEPDPVRQDLQDAGGARVGLAVGGGQLVLPGDGGRFGSGSRPVPDRLQTRENEVRDLDVVHGSGDVEHGVLGRQRHGDGDVLALARPNDRACKYQAVRHEVMVEVNHVVLFGWQKTRTLSGG